MFLFSSLAQAAILFIGVTISAVLVGNQLGIFSVKSESAWLKGFVSLSPDPFIAFLFSFLFVRDTNLAHPIKNCSLHSLV